MKLIRRSAPIDTARIKMSRSGIVETPVIEQMSPERDVDNYSPDIDDATFECPKSNTKEEANTNAEYYLSRRTEIWAPLIEGKSRIISQGDADYDLGQEIYAIIPSCSMNNNPSKGMTLIRGTISNLMWKSADTLDIPRDLRNGLETASTTDRMQTIFTHVALILDSSYAAIQNSLDDSLPYGSDLKITRVSSPQTTKKSKKSKGSNRKSTEITIPHHHILGTSQFVRKYFNTLDDNVIQRWLDKCKINVRDGVEEVDTGIQMIVKDIFVTHPLHIQYVVLCKQQPYRILNIKKLQCFDIRGCYDHSGYHAFRVIDLNNLKIHSPSNNDHTRTEISRKLKEIFDIVGVYSVKKSLCGHNDVDSKIYEDAYGSSQILSKHYSQPPAEGLRFTGITLTSYAKGLAYLEGQEPFDGVSYIFFHSKDYYEIVLDPTSSEFMQFVPAEEKHKLFRNPDPGDIILANSFICEKGQYTGKTNLKWFFPSDDFRLLHLYITKPHMRMALGKAIANKKFESPCLDLYNLVSFGTSSANTTKDSPVSKAFIQKYFWWLS
jgi:hypothetical protein